MSSPATSAPTGARPDQDTNASRTLGRHVAIYGLSTVLVHSVGLVTAPIFTRHFGPERYGVLEVMSASVTLAVTVLLAGFDVAVGRSFVASARIGDRQTMVSTGFIAVVGAACTASLAAVALSGPLAGLILGDRGLSSVVTAAALGVPLTVAAAFIRRVMRLEGRAWLSLISATLLAGGGAIGAVVLAVHLSLGLKGVYFGLAAGTAAAVVLSVIANRHLLRLRFSRCHLVTMAAVGIPLVPAALSTWALRMIDRFFLVRWEDLGALGRYGVANRVANVLLLAVLTFDAVWIPFILRLHGDDSERARRVQTQILPVVVGGMALLGVAVAAFGPELLAVVADDRFEDAARLVPVLVLALVLFAATPVTVSAAVVAGRTGGVALHAGIAAAVNIVACVALVPLWGTAGAAWATVVAFAYQAIAYYRLAQSLGAVDEQRGRVIGAVALCIPYLALGYLDIGPVWATVAAKSLAVASFPLALWATRIVDGYDVRHLGIIGREGR